MAHVACPFCFGRIDSGRLAFQCTGNGNVKCTKAVDPERERLTDSRMATYPTFVAAVRRGADCAECPKCGGPARRRACPECHTALPIEFVNSKSQMIGLVGAKGTGKTVLMTVLVKQLREVVGRRFDADIRIVTDNPDGYGGLTAYHENREMELFRELTLPVQTAQYDAGRVPIVLRWRQMFERAIGRSMRASIFSFVDTAGEDLTSIEIAFTLRYLNVADALILVLDPFMLPGARARANIPSDAVEGGENLPMEVLSRVTELLRTQHGIKAKKKIKIPIGLVFTKIDAFYGTLDPGNPIMGEARNMAAYDDVDGQSVHENMLALLHEWHADDIDTHLRLNYTDFRYFGVSALGEQPDYARKIASSRGVRPHRVEDPVLWLLARTGAVARQ